MPVPSFTNRTPNEIVTETNFFESSGRTFKALSWIDYAKSNRSISALEYAALETRLAIEQLLFEQLIVGVGTKLEAREYKKCTGNAKKLNELLERLIPRYERLIEFTKAMAPAGIPITKWNNRALIEHSGKVSKYLHWSGGLDETTQSSTWYEKGISVIEAAANYIWHGLTTGNTGVMAIEKLEPEMRELWDLYANDQITLESAVKRAEILEPILQARLTRRSTGPARKAAQAG
ncbi:MAG: hypothetical protein CVU18_16520 [Betaproteobacteria bacterium HGW-Betaproteobacteria-12]|nr:MAG: hypothetical protein CVU18_16520 [Betaproteobacteria bacterium HGW-Betaproteobacteria-12]